MYGDQAKADAYYRAEIKKWHEMVEAIGANIQ
jgi:hypothetical protein